MPDIAKDVQTGFLVSASRGIRKRKYTCVCPDAHAVCLRKGLKNIPHFAHIPCRSQDGVFVPSCRAGGESEQHIRAKHKLVEWQGRYRFTLRTCEVCQEKDMEDCCEGSMQIEARSSDKRWRYDVLFTRSDNTQLALEVYHKHPTGDEKVRSSAVSGILVAEFDAESILSLKPDGVLDNKRDTSWICSEKCRKLKELREIQAKQRAQQQEEARRRAQQQEEARRRAQQQEETKLLARQQEQGEIKPASKMLFGFACLSSGNPVNPALFHALGAVSVESVKFGNMDLFFIKTPSSSISIESVLVTLDSFGISPVRLTKDVPEILAIETCTRCQRQDFFRHIKINRKLHKRGMKTTYWHWNSSSHSGPAKL